MKINYPVLLTNHFYEEIIEHLDQLEEAYNRKSILSITFKFPKSDFGTLSEEIDDKSRKLDLFYKKICSHVIGRRYLSDPNGVMPIAWAFLEPGEHKYATRIKHFNDLHFHTVWLIDKCQLDAFYAAVDKARKMEIPHFSQIYIDKEVEFCASNTQNIFNVLSYASKFQRILENSTTMSKSILKFPDDLNAEFKTVRVHHDLESQMVVL